MLSAAACCSQISESAKAAKRKYADILPSPIFIPSPCQEECNKIDVETQGVTEEVFVASRGEAVGFALWNKNALVAFTEIKTCRIRELSCLCVRWAVQSRVLSISTAVTSCLDWPLLWNAPWMDVAVGALPMLWLDIRHLWSQLRLVSTHPHKSFLAEGTKHVIPSPLYGTAMDSELETGMGWEEGRRLCTTGVGLMLLSLQPESHAGVNLGRSKSWGWG